MISIIQLLIVSILGLLYAVSPKAFSSDVDFAPVPWVLTAYVAFSLLRFYLALKHQLPDWMLYLSSVIDIVLLMGLIWSFHLQYEQLPSFYLKAPTLLYVFIFISIRTLHFDPRFVLATGFSAAFGWALMVFFALSYNPDSDIITRDYIEYITSNRVLIGAEFDKIISILIVTTVLALALHRARQLLIVSVVDSSAVKDLSHFVPDEIAQQVIHSEEGVITGKGEVKETTILFSDIEGFTSISETLTPEQLIEALNQYFSLIAQPIEKYGGVISQFQGDAILATFNAPKPNKYHAKNAVLAAIDIQKSLKNKVFGSNIPFNTRIGINSGHVVGGLVGASGTRVSYTVHGADVNLAARLEQLNKEYGTRVIISEKTYDLIPAGVFKFKALGDVSIRGRNQKINIFTLDESSM